MDDRLVRAAGTARERGESIGAAAGERIRALLTRAGSGNTGTGTGSACTAGLPGHAQVRTADPRARAGDGG